MSNYISNKIDKCYLIVSDKITFQNKGELMIPNVFTIPSSETIGFEIRLIECTINTQLNSSQFTNTFEIKHSTNNTFFTNTYDRRSSEKYHLIIGMVDGQYYLYPNVNIVPDKEQTLDSLLNQILRVYNKTLWVDKYKLLPEDFNRLQPYLNEYCEEYDLMDVYKISFYTTGANKELGYYTSYFPDTPYSDINYRQLKAYESNDTLIGEIECLSRVDMSVKNLGIMNYKLSVSYTTDILPDVINKLTPNGAQSFDFTKTFKVILATSKGNILLPNCGVTYTISNYTYTITLTTEQFQDFNIFLQ